MKGQTQWQQCMQARSGAATSRGAGDGLQQSEDSSKQATRSSPDWVETQTNPEELLGAAHAACFSMMVSALASNLGLTPNRISTDAAVTFGPVDGGLAITGIALTCEADIPGIDAEGFAELAENAKNNCPVSKALAGTTITLTATLAE
ncbi:MAG: OsmC family peroxiredoxin [Armatimonas sp.]